MEYSACFSLIFLFNKLPLPGFELWICGSTANALILWVFIRLYVVEKLGLNLTIIFLFFCKWTELWSHNVAVVRQAWQPQHRHHGSVWHDVGIKSSSIFPKVCPKEAAAVFTQKVVCFKTGQNVTKYFGYFWKKFCHQDLSKFAQSGHAECDREFSDTQKSDIDGLFFFIFVYWMQQMDISSDCSIRTRALLNRSDCSANCATATDCDFWRKKVPLRYSRCCTYL